MDTVKRWLAGLWHGLGVTVGVSAFVAFCWIVWWVMKPYEHPALEPPPPMPNPEDIDWGSRESAWWACKQEARVRLKVPGSATFPDYDAEESPVAHFPPAKYLVAAYVDAQNTYGMWSRAKYGCSVRFTAPQSWVLVEFMWLGEDPLD